MFGKNGGLSRSDSTSFQFVPLKNGCDLTALPSAPSRCAGSNCKSSVMKFFVQLSTCGSFLNLRLFILPPEKSVDKENKSIVGSSLCSVYCGDNKDII